MKPPGSPADLPRNVRLFPLEGVLLLPRAVLPLNIFEPRYLEMVQDAIRGDKMIAIIQPRTREPNTAPLLYDVGTVGQITQYSETGDGRLLIALKGLARFRIREEKLVPTAYRQAEVDYQDFAGDWSPPLPLAATVRADLESTLREYLAAIDLTADWEAVQAADDESLVSTLATACAFQPSERQALLEAPSLAERTDILTTLMRFAFGPAGLGASVQ